MEGREYYLLKGKPLHIHIEFWTINKHMKSPAGE